MLVSDLFNGFTVKDNYAELRESIGWRKNFYEAFLTELPAKFHSAEGLYKNIKEVIDDCQKYGIEPKKIGDGFWKIDEDIKKLVQVNTTSQGATVVISPRVSPEQLAAVESHLSALVKPKEKEVIASQFEAHRAIVTAMLSPASLGETFPPIPQLCFDVDGDVILVDREALSEMVSWDLLDSKVQLENFHISDDLKIFEIDLNGEKLVYQLENIKQIELDNVKTNLTELDLIYWLDRAIRNPAWGITQPVLQNYLTKLVRYLMADRRLSLTALVRAKTPLSKAISAEINRLKERAIESGYQALLPGMRFPSEEEMPFYSFRFEAGQYPRR